ncbi:MAG TPA: polymer-forming cytoskeletal protein [Thermoanaerobaculia bacterium]|nr:polymer-forming cytoskeletal protein [Thermoanaerobaculia bacterium]
MAIFTKDPAPQKSVPPKPESAGARTTFIGAHIVFDGALSGNENVLVEGVIKGKVDLQGDFRIGGSARVEAVVHAKNVTIEGTLIGDVSADNRVELMASSRVDGNIKAPRIVVSEGAKFKGAVDMSGGKNSDVETVDSKEKANAGNRDQKQK